MKKRILSILIALVVILTVLLLVTRPKGSKKPSGKKPAATAVQESAAEPSEDPSAQPSPESDTPEASVGSSQASDAPASRDEEASDISAGEIPSQASDPEVPAKKNPTFEDLEVIWAGTVSGAFVEDGSSKEVSGIYAIEVRNNGDRTLQYAVLTFSDADTDYSFSLTTLPPGETVLVEEQSANTGTADLMTCSAEAEYLVWFPEEPSLYPDVFSLTGDGDALMIENLTDSDIPGPIYVYYKTVSDGELFGGITYRVAVEEGLAAGESKSVYSGHYSAERSRILFVTYGA